MKNQVFSLFLLILCASVSLNTKNLTTFAAKLLKI